ncbi:MAG TPA: CidA/LrgA family protein [Casimicrobiaceae bacterium]|jgi:holin-like protein|nr:CidA/LrgA family protein [Casimicrobiaceae bacterium]
MNALRGFGWLLLCQSAGEVVARGMGVKLPGPVIGMLLMLVALNVRWVREPVEAAADALLAHLSLLFVPVGVGVVVHLGLLAHYGWRLAVVVVASTLLGMTATALVLRRLWQRSG